MVSAIVTAAGAGVRFGGEKILVPVRGRPLLYWTLERIRLVPGVSETVLVLPRARIETVQRRHGEELEALGVSRYAAGGETRQESVERGLAALGADDDLVLVHDAVRPNFSPAVAAEAVRVAGETGAAIVAVPARDTLKRVDSELRIVGTVPREEVWHAETPQVFRRSLLAAAFAAARAEGFTGTDEASLVERTGNPVAVVRGGPFNVKVTERADLSLLAAVLGGEVAG